MTTKNLKIFHDLNRLDTEEKKAAREKAIADKIAAAAAQKALEDSGHARAIIGNPTPSEPDVDKINGEVKAAEQYQEVLKEVDKSVEEEKQKLIAKKEAILAELKALEE